MFAVKRPAAWSLASRAWQANVTRSGYPRILSKGDKSHAYSELTLLKAKADRK